MHLYALGLSDSRTYRSVVAWAAEVLIDNEVRAGNAFMKWLLNGRLREIDEPKAGCLVCY